ncbi:hypothetical protein FOS14_07435 [Skermania sp. ID1734]|uniref:hypothetical protein n=1 Tax=Skermania sp. ID1734 TaxID=2597516 RepID=UPI00117C404F|nr:hypothetical protein [Skermania sp. ID1734]TSE00257.1 hypothetical protein FOS14_07435 [Skermania sp. ID1734]
MGETRPLPAEVEAVVQRWDPEGLDGLQRAWVRNPATLAVHIAGPGGVGKTELEHELRLLAPELDWATSPVEAAVFVLLVDAAAPIGRDTLRAAENIRGPVLYAMNKIDAHRDWRAVAARNLEILRTQVDPDARLWPVSARLARTARQLANTHSDRVLAHSGIRELLDAIAQELREQTGETRDSRLQVAEEALIARTRERIRAAMAAAQRDEETQALRAERAAVLAGRDGARADAIAGLRAQLQLARGELTHDIGNRVRAAHTASRAEIARANRRALRAYPRRLQETITELTTTVEEAAVRRLQQVAALDEIAADLRLPEPVEALALDAPQPRHRGIEDRVMVAFGASAGVGVSRLVVSPLSMIPALDIATIPVSLALGGFAAWWLARSRAQLADRAHVQQWAADTLVTAKADLEHRVQALVVETEAQLTARLREITARNSERIDARLAALDGRLREIAAKRAGRLAVCERDLQILTEPIAALARQKG